MNEQGKVWLITGTSSGFGRSIAEEVLARGGQLVAAARELRSLDALVAQAPDRVLAVKLDVTEPAEIRSAVRAALERFGRIDVLVNNAGFSVVGAVEETGDEALRATFEPMFFGAVALTREVLPHMRARGSGTIVQLTSMGGFSTAPGFGAYCAAKHALEALSDALATEVAPLGLRVLIVEPGAFRTGLFGSSFRVMPELSAYAATVGPVRAYTQHAAGTQPGDPAKAARAIADAVAAGAPSLRLPLGADAVQSIREKLLQVRRDVDAAERVAISTSF